MRASSQTVPFARLAALLAVLIAAGPLAGCGGGNAPGGGGSTAQKKLALGQRVYQQQCVTCHQASGEGVAGVYPTLHATRWTTGDRGRLIRLVLHGMEGPVEIKGQTYDQRMRPLPYLTDEEVAAVLTYVRQNFGNDATAVQAEQVAAVRAATAGREAVWSPDALWKATGVPAARPDSAARDSTASDTSRQSAATK